MAYDNVITQLRTLTKKVGDLETSNSSILKLLNERSERSLDTVTTELQTTLKCLKSQSGKSSEDLNILKEHLKKLNDHVAKLSSAVHRWSVVEKRGSTNSNVKLETRTRPTSADVYEESSRKSNSLIPYTAPNSVSEHEHSESQKSNENSTEPDTEENFEGEEFVKPVRPPLHKNKFGLKCHSVSPESDNRLRLPENNTSSGPSNSQTCIADKLNLPTRQELKDRARNRKEKESLRESKQVPQPPDLLKNPFKNLAGLNKDPDNTPDIKDLNTWRSLAETEKRRGQTMAYLSKGKGPDTCLLLDISGSMAGEPFNQMMVAVITFINDIAGVAASVGIEENIGIATFGEQTRVIQHMTNEYDQIIKSLDSLYPSGPSPMAAGLYMGLACCLGNPSGASIQGVRLYSRIIMFTDGRGTLDNMMSGDDDCDSSLEANVLRCAWLTETAEDLERRSIRVYSVSLGNTESSSLETVCAITHGKMYTSNEIPKLVTMTQATVKTIELLKAGVDFDENENERGGQSAIAVHRALHGDLWEEILHLGKFYANQELSLFSEFNGSNLPPLGSRVRRGPDWKWANQDQGGAGTVVGHASNMVSVWVKWDCGHKNVYSFLPLTGQEVVVVDEPRKLDGEIIAVGCRVERGKDWSDGNKDGGAGNIGVVIKVRSNGIVIVRWPNKHKGKYKFGYNGLFEVKLCDQARFDVGERSVKRTQITGASNRHTDRNSPSENELPSGTSTEYDIQKLSGDLHLKEKEGLKSAQDAKKPLTLEELNERNRQKQLKEQSEMEKISWTYQKDSVWQVLPKDINEKMEKAYGRNKHGSMILEVDGYTWRASFSDMKMTCQKTHTVVDIARNVDH
uniref:Uncharacterized protein LOC111129304 isoform X2 n=1 Tax=Crassostrea virginica TaxID=6565 RepID=A0A8B8DSU2_CRAVI|nr:uncharacterized protein LOC111129304 isoform X2 [Crassostrea virginica]